MSAYGRALALKQDLLKQMEVLQARLQEVDTYLRLSEKLGSEMFKDTLLGDSEKSSALRQENRPHQASSDEVRSRLVDLVQRAEERTRKLPKGKTLADAAQAILRRHHRPLPTRELLHYLRAEGFGGLLSGDDTSKQLNRLSVLLSGDDRFAADRTQGWSLRSWSAASSWIDMPPSRSTDGFE